MVTWRQLRDEITGPKVLRLNEALPGTGTGRPHRRCHCCSLSITTGLLEFEKVREGVGQLEQEGEWDGGHILELD